jgi:CBS domain-containing protein
MNAADAMTRNVVSVRPDASIVQAIRLMLQHGISGLPVIDDAGKLVGIVTEGDLLRRAETGTERRRPRWLEFLLGPGRLAGDYVRTHGRKVAEVMTGEVATVDEATPLPEVVRIMEERRVKRLPVVRDGALVGIVSRANLLRALAVATAEVAPSLSSDSAIRDRLAAEVEKQNWAPPTIPNFVVRNGVVHVWGLVTSDQQRAALKVMAENIPGVKAVRDHLVWIEPYSGIVVESLEEDGGLSADATGTTGPQQPHA